MNTHSSRTGAGARNAATLLLTSRTAANRPPASKAGSPIPGNQRKPLFYLATGRKYRLPKPSQARYNSGYCDIRKANLKGFFARIRRGKFTQTYARSR